MVEYLPLMDQVLSLTMEDYDLKLLIVGFVALTDLSGMSF